MGRTDYVEGWGTSRVNTRLLGSSGSIAAARLAGVVQPLDRHLVLAALLVAMGYYAGVKIGFALTFQPHPISVLWPPNAILLGALLVTPARWWVWLLLAAFGAHLVAQLQAAVPGTLVVLWFISNVAEALIGAIYVRRYLRWPPALDSLRGVAVFILFAAFLAPFLTSFLDAAFVKLIGWGHGGYWELWRTRFFSNVLTTLTVVPVIIALAGQRWAALRSPDPLRMAEASVLLFSVVAMCFAVFLEEQAGTSATPALLYLPLPFLLWAALRFGPPGAALAFMVVSFTAILGAGRGLGPFASGSPIENAHEMQVFLTFVSVTLLSLAAAVQERLGAEARLRASEERFATAFRSSPDAVSIRRQSDGRIIEINDRWQATFGYTREEVIGRTHWDLGLYANDADYARFVAFTSERNRERDLEVKLRARDGREVLALVAVESVELGGEPCVIVTLRDVTEQRRTEIEARAQRQQLTHLTRVATVGELSGALAHELNQPLTAILSNAQAAQRFLARDPVDLAEIRAILGDIVEADKRAGEVIRRLRAMLKKGEVQFAPIDLNELLADVLDLAHGDLVTRHVSVTTRFNSGLPPVQGDRVELQQLFLNLIANACEAMSARDQGQRELAVTTTYDWDGTVQAAVADRGPGIPPDRLERLFEPFYTTREQGLGLGLAICRTIASTHGGRIWAENNGHGGATFRVAIPTGREHAA